MLPCLVFILPTKFEKSFYSGLESPWSSQLCISTLYCFSKYSDIEDYHVSKLSFQHYAFLLKISNIHEDWNICACSNLIRIWQFLFVILWLYTGFLSKMVVRKKWVHPKCCEEVGRCWSIRVYVRQSLSSISDVASTFVEWHKFIFCAEMVVGACMMKPLLITLIWLTKQLLVIAWLRNNLTRFLELVGRLIHLDILQYKATYLVRRYHIALSSVPFFDYTSLM